MECVAWSGKVKAGLRGTAVACLRLCQAVRSFPSTRSTLVVRLVRSAETCSEAGLSSGRELAAGSQCDQAGIEHVQMQPPHSPPSAFFSRRREAKLAAGTQAFDFGAPLPVLSPEGPDTGTHHLWAFTGWKMYSKAVLTPKEGPDSAFRRL